MYVYVSMCMHLCTCIFVLVCVCVYVYVGVYVCIPTVAFSVLPYIGWYPCVSIIMCFGISDIFLGKYACLFFVSRIIIFAVIISG